MYEYVLFEITTLLIITRGKKQNAFHSPFSSSSFAPFFFGSHSTNMPSKGGKRGEGGERGEGHAIERERGGAEIEGRKKEEEGPFLLPPSHC